MAGSAQISWEPLNPTSAQQAHISPGQWVLGESQAAGFVIPALPLITFLTLGHDLTYL